jgi:ADP-heptose:LPS heptosyltransferase
MHIAAALGVPTVALFGTGIDRTFAPLGEHHESVIAHPEAGSSPEVASPRGPYEDVSRVSVAQVLEATDRALQKSRTNGEGARQARLLLNHARR